MRWDQTQRPGFREYLYAQYVDKYEDPDYHLLLFVINGPQSSIVIKVYSIQFEREEEAIWHVLPLFYKGRKETY